LRLSLDRLAVLVLTVAAVLVLELLNTAIEAVVDLAIGRKFHPLARIAKDCAAAAVLVAALSSLLIALLLLVPPLMQRFGLLPA
jgi:diacylglycerol kinase (ATP)